MENCKTKEDIMEKVLKGGNNLEASKRFLKLGFTDESIKFYLLSQQENFLENFNQQISVAENIINSNKTAGQFMIEASQNNQRTAQQMVCVAEEFQEASRRIMNTMQR